MKWINFGCSEFLNQITQVILVLMCVGFRIYHVGNNEQTVPLPASNFSLIVLFNPSGTQCTVPLPSRRVLRAFSERDQWSRSH